MKYIEVVVTMPQFIYEQILKCQVTKKTIASIFSNGTTRQKMGRWEWVPYDDYPNIGNWHCSECRTIITHMPKGTDNTPTYKWCPMCGAKMSENPTGSNCTACILDGTDACSRGAGRAVDGRVCEDFVGESED